MDEKGINAHTGKVIVLALSYGAWFWLHVLFSYALLFAGAVLLIRAMKSRPYQHRGQMITLLVGLAIAWIGNLLYLVDLNPVAPLDISLFTLVISSLVIAWGLIRYPPTAGIPIARHNLVDKMKDGVIVLDLQNRVIDMNRMAQVILECTSQSAVGLPIQSLWKLWPRDITFPLSEVEIVRELIQEIDGEYRTLEQRITTLMERSEGYTGRLVVIHDNTPRKRAEESLLRREMILEAISFSLTFLPFNV